MYRFILIIVCLFTVNTLSAQRHLNGKWVGTITEGNEEHRIEIVLSKKGRKIKARTYIFFSDSTSVEMVATGLWHGDRSMNLFEMKRIWPDAQDESDAFFTRTYQLLYQRSFNDFMIEGWWQEKEKGNYDRKRKFGKIYLEPVLTEKA
jgi:hypothetical protein